MGRSPPAPSLRELSSECETEGVYYDARNRSKISEPIKTVRKPSARWNHRTTLPQSALAGCQLPQRGSREGLSPSIRVLAKIRGCGRFSSPLRNSKDFGLYHSTNDTPSVSPSGCQLPQRGSRETLPFIRLLAKIPGFGRFSSPLRSSGCFSAPAHRSAWLTWGWCFRLPVGGRCGWRRAPGGWTCAWPCRGRAGPVGAGRPGRSGRCAA